MTLTTKSALSRMPTTHPVTALTRLLVVSLSAEDWRHMRSKLLLLLLAFTITACTPAQVAVVLHEPVSKVTPQQVRDVTKLFDAQQRNNREASGAFLRVAQGLHNTPVLACIRHHESDTAGGYTAYNPGGPYYGAYQYLQGTWNWAAAHYGGPQYAGVDPRSVPGFWQDLVTLNYHNAVGDGPWGNRC